MGVAIFGVLYSPEIRQHPFFYLLLASLLSFLSSCIVSYGHISTISFEFISLVVMLFYIQRFFKSLRLLLVLFILNGITLLAYILFHGAFGFLIRSPELSTFSNFIHLITGIGIMFEIMENGAENKIQNDPNFWFVTSWLFFVSTIFIRDLAQWGLGNLVPSELRSISVGVANVVFYSCLLIGFIKCKHKIPA